MISRIPRGRKRSRPTQIVAGAVVALGVAGCIGGTTPGYQLLQSAMKDRITNDNHRPVASVACRPHVESTSREETARLRCLVRFKDGSSYVADAVIQNENFGGTHNRPDQLSWELPPPPTGPDITRSLPARPSGAAAAVTATSAGSLFKAVNLAPVLKRLTSRFGASRAILQLGLYPGELDLVILDGQQARLVRAASTGALSVGPRTQFTGRRNAVQLSQLRPRVPEGLAARIARRGGVPTSRLDRMVLLTSLSDSHAGWAVYPTTGSGHFESLLTGRGLSRVSRNGRRAL